jgi:hypothetical protein
MKKPIPMAQVWVLVGMGTGTGMAENTHGLPVHLTSGDISQGSRVEISGGTE